MAVVETNQTAVIAASGTTSGAVDLGDRTLTTLVFPATFTGATVTLQTAEKLTGTYQTLQDATGAAITYTVTQGKNTRIEPKDSAGIRYFKVVSASTEGSSRTIGVFSRQMA